MANKVELPDKVQVLVDNALSAVGHTSRGVRRAVVARAAAFAGGPDADEADVPEVFRSFVEKVARHAYKTTDEDFVELKRAGHCEDEVFEVTVLTAIGASLARFQRGLDLLAEEDPSCA